MKLLDRLLSQKQLHHHLSWDESSSSTMKTTRAPKHLLSSVLQLVPTVSSLQA